MGEGKTIYCQIGKEVAFAPLMSSGIMSLVFLFLGYMQRESRSFIDEFDALYHTDFSIAVIRKLLEEENIQVVHNLQKMYKTGAFHE